MRLVRRGGGRHRAKPLRRIRDFGKTEFHNDLSDVPLYGYCEDSQASATLCPMDTEHGNSDRYHWPIAGAGESMPAQGDREPAHRFAAGSTVEVKAK